MFSMFPDRSPGAGLLLLRTTAGAVLITQGVAYLSDRSELGFFALVVVSVLSIVGLLLLVGFLTRAVALVAAVIGVNTIIAWFPSAPLVTPMTAVLFVVIAIAVICLGPGAYSLDARLFGRREIVIPTRSPKE
jgi:uncharacterized membrane protein YphA (DoxX/SURF4 family)